MSNQMAELDLQIPGQQIEQQTNDVRAGPPAVVRIRTTEVAVASARQWTNSRRTLDPATPVIAGTNAGAAPLRRSSPCTAWPPK